MLPRSKSKRITVDGNRYRYLVTESAKVQDGVVPLAVTAQLGDTSGSLLRVIGLTARRWPEKLSKFYMGRSLDLPLGPRHVARLIRLGVSRGWEPGASGPVVILQANNSDVFDVEQDAE